MRILTAFFTLLLIASTHAQPLKFRQLTVKDGMPNNSVIGLGEDASGHLWIATPSALCSYDGEQFTLLPIDRLPNKRVDRINRDASGKMWVQCYEQHDMVSCYDSLAQQFVTYHKDDMSDSLWREAVKPLNRTFADRRSPRVWSVEKRMLWQKDATGQQAAFSYSGKMAAKTGLTDEVVFSLLMGSGGILWVGSANDGLFFADTRKSSYQRLVFKPATLVRATCSDHNGTLWFATPSRLNVWKKGDSDYHAVSYPLTDSIEGRRIRPIIEDRRNRLWLGTFDGLYLKDGSGETFRNIAFADKKTHAIYDLKEDDEGRLWIGTEKGLYRTNLNSPDLRPQLIDSTLMHIIDMSIGGGKCWIATVEGLYRWHENGLKKYYDKEVHSVMTDGQGHVWMGTDSGLCRVTDDGVTPFPSPADGHIVKNLLCSRDFLWCCYDQGICCINIYTGKLTKLRTLHNEYFEGSASFDKQMGNLFFGGSKGIDCFNIDSLDDQLRRVSRQLWLDEERTEVLIQEDTGSDVLWWIAVIGIFAAGGLLLLFYIKRKKVQQPVHEETTEKPSPLVEKATAIVKAHMSDADFTAEHLAQEMAMSRTKLFTLMKQETGKAAMEFVRDIRLDYAARQLEAGTPVADIAMACGFSDASSFRRAFVKKFGVTPSQYRQNKAL